MITNNVSVPRWGSTLTIKTLYYEIRCIYTILCTARFCCVEPLRGIYELNMDVFSTILHRLRRKSTQSAKKPDGFLWAYRVAIQYCRIESKYRNNLPPVGGDKQIKL